MAHRLRHWPNIETTLGQVLVFVGMVWTVVHDTHVTHPVPHELLVGNAF